MTSIAFKKDILNKIFTTSFGKQYDPVAASSLLNEWQTGNFNCFPELKILSSPEINGANGAYNIDTNKIYIYSSNEGVDTK